MSELKYNLIPVKEKPQSKKKKRHKEIKKDEAEEKYLKGIGYKADYIQEIYKKMEKK